LADTQADTNDAMLAKVHELTAAAATPYARIQAIAHYVQQIKYVAIETNLARGGGYQPHMASQVFTRNYGDCKDKANLMRAMLKIAGLDSYLVAIFSGDPYSVHPEWPSPEQFNHMIIAVRVPDDVSVGSVFTHPQLGRLLIFDPTSESTPAGDIPNYEQGSYALVLAGSRGDLVKIPFTPAEADRTSVEVRGTLSETGALDVAIAMSSQGQSAAFLRGIYAEADPRRVTEALERWIASSTKQSSLKNVQSLDAFDKGQFGLSLDVSAPAYAQVAQQRMMIFKPAIISRFGGFELQNDKRENPVVLEAQCYHKSVHIKLPNGFKVDEMPDEARFESKFGKFASSYKLDGSDFVFTEDLDISAAMVPAADYEQLKGFIKHVYGAEQAPLLLLRN
jgi:transglutaminase superfamily protein